MTRKMVLITQSFIYLVARLLSVPLVLISVFVPIPVHTQADLVQVRLGVPVRFMVQDQIGYLPPLPWPNPLLLPLGEPNPHLAARAPTFAGHRIRGDQPSLKWSNLCSAFRTLALN